MKKLISFLLTVCMCFSASVMLTACVEEHTHTYKTEWSKDATHHWYDCETDDCTEKKDKEEHAYTDGVCVCGAEDPNYQQSSSTLSKADYVEVLTSAIQEKEPAENN